MRQWNKLCSIKIIPENSLLSIRFFRLTFWCAQSVVHSAIFALLLSAWADVDIIPYCLLWNRIDLMDRPLSIGWVRAIVRSTLWKRRGLAQLSRQRIISKLHMPESLICQWIKRHSFLRDRLNDTAGRPAWKAWVIGDGGGDKAQHPPRPKHALLSIKVENFPTVFNVWLIDSIMDKVSHHFPVDAGLINPPRKAYNPPASVFPNQLEEIVIHENAGDEFAFNFGPITGNFEFGVHQHTAFI